MAQNVNTMRNFYQLVAFLLVFGAYAGQSLHGQTTIAGGNVSGVWSLAGSPYQINGSISVATGTTLEIEPGVEVLFGASVSITIQGRLVAQGTESSPVSFSARNSILGWRGLRFNLGATPDSSVLDFCIVEYVRGTGIQSAIRIENSDRIRISNSSIINNQGSNGGGISGINSNIFVYKNTIYNNQTLGSGGGLYFENCAPEIVENTIKNNKAFGAGTGGGGIFLNTAPAYIAANTISNNQSLDGGSGAGIACLKSDAEIIANSLSNNFSAASAGGIYCDQSNPLITLNTISSNVVDSAGGAICCVQSGGKIINNQITDNQTISGQSTGGGIALRTSSTAIKNNLIANNSSNLGGGIACAGNSNPEIFNNTICNNTGEQGGGIFLQYNSSPQVKNCIVYNNYASTGQQVFLRTNDCNPDIFYSDIQGGTADFGTPAMVTYTGAYFNNIDQDPLFEDEISQNYQLLASSQCINTGTPDTTGMNLPETDLAGNARIYNDALDVIDMGAFEYDDFENICGDIGGNQNWSGKIKITCDVNILNGATVTIAPGTYIEARGRYALNVQGRLLAQGNSTDSIIFTADPANGWRGIRFYNNNSTDSSLIEYCRIENAIAEAAYPDNRGGALYVSNFSLLRVSNSVLKNNTAGNGGGFYLDNADVVFNACQMHDNSAASLGGAGYLANSDASISESVLNNNSAKYGGALRIYFSAPTLSKNFIYANFSTTSGGAVSAAYSQIQYVNNLFVANSSSNYAGAIAEKECSSLFVNNTITDNTANTGGALVFSGGTATLYNSIIFSNTASTQGNQVYLETASTPPTVDFYNCDIEGGTAAFGGIAHAGDYKNCIESDPRFSGTGTHIYSLKNNSPCIDKGVVKCEIFPLPDTDLRSFDRIMGNGIEIGAYEKFDAASVEYVSGSISGNTTWSGTVLVACDVTVEDGSTLTIDPATEVIFQGANALYVEGRLLAQGTATDSIRFTMTDTSGFYQNTHEGWYGIHFSNNSSADSSIIDFCVLEYAKTRVANGGTTSTVQTGGAVYVNNFSKLRISRSNLRKNYAEKAGGAIACHASSPAIIGNTLRNNYSLAAGAIYLYDGSSPRISHNQFVENQSDENGGAIYCSLNSEPKIYGNFFEANITQNPTSYGGAISLNNSSPQIEDNSFVGNSAGSGGALFAGTNSEPTVLKNFFAENTASNGGALCINNATPRLEQNVVAKNSATSNGGAIYFSGNIFPAVLNNSFSGNRAAHGGAFYLKNFASPQTYNNVLWWNRASSAGNQVYIASTDCSPLFGYSNIEGSTGGFGGVSTGASLLNSFSANPQFADTAAYDFSLLDNSACINTGTPDTSGLELSATDINGDTRIFDNVIDIGAYEFQATPSVIFANGEIRTDRTWCADTVKMLNHVDVQSGIKLEICAGTFVQPQGYYALSIYGQLYAKGTATDSIVFSPLNLSEKWAGIVIENATPPLAGDSTLFAFCRIEQAKDSASKENGAILISASKNVVFQDCHLRENQALEGGAIHSSESQISITNTLFENNQAEKYGGAIYSYRDTFDISTSVFLENSSISTNGDGGAIFMNQGEIDIRQSSFQKNLGRYAAGIAILSATAEITDSEFSDNQNPANDATGGAIYIENGQATLQNNLIRNNSNQRGGGLYLSDIDDNSVFSNNQIYHNTAEKGAAILLNSASPRLQNNTITQNSATEGVVQLIYSSPEFFNNILWDNTCANAFYLGSSSCSPQISYSLIQGGLAGIQSSPFGGSYASTLYNKNIALDPAFTSPGTNDFSLQAHSPCINTGTPDTTGLSIPPSDFNANQRIFTSGLQIIDIGASEYQALPGYFNVNRDITTSETFPALLSNQDTIRVFNNVAVAEETELEIEAGAFVQFQGHYALNVSGTLTARGTLPDTITFTVADTTGLSNTGTSSGSWFGVRFINPAVQDTSLLYYCKLEYAKSVDNDQVDGYGGAIYTNTSKLKVSNSLIWRNVAHYGAGIFCEMNVSPHIFNNKIVNNYATLAGGGLAAATDAAPEVSNNIICNNFARYGSAFFTDGGIFTNNTIAHNKQSELGGAVLLTGTPELYNNIVHENYYSGTTNSQIYISEGNPRFEFNLLQGGIGNISGANKGVFENNINADPQLVSPTANPGIAFNAATADWGLKQNSPCINTAIPDTLGLNIPPQDLHNNPRIFAGTVQRIDMGALEYQGDPSENFVHGTLTENTYWCTDTIKVIGDITIPDAISLEICPSTTVLFEGYFEINVQGQLLAQGLASDTIRFTPASQSTGWHGLRFFDIAESNDSSLLEFCKIEYAQALSGSDDEKSGGGIFVKNTNKIRVENSLLQYNQAVWGGAVALITSSGVFRGNSLKNNAASLSGAGFFCYNGANPTLWGNTIFQNQSTENGAAIAADRNSSPKIKNNQIYANLAGKNGGAIYCNEESNAQITNNLIYANQADTLGGGIASFDSYPEILTNYLGYNQAKRGAGIHLSGWSEINLSNNQITDNVASAVGGAVSCDDFASPYMANNTISRNQAPATGGVWCNNYSNPTILNSILWENTNGQLSLNTCIADLFYSAVQGGTSGISGASNLNEYEYIFEGTPGFVDAPAGNYHLQASSQLINAGYEATDTTKWSTDLDGNLRIYNDTRIDIGAYEHPYALAQCDSLMLVEFYNSTQGANWANTLSGVQPWLVGEVANWFGVVLDMGRVSALSLPGNQLNGSFPAGIDSLRYLEKMQLYDNTLNVLIPQIGNMSSLKILNLRDARLSGQIPPEWANLQSLVSLNLSNNTLEGTIPQELENLSNLSLLELSENQFDSLANLSPVGLENLQLLSVNNNRLTFDDIEHNLNKFADFNYSPQDSINTIDTIEVVAGNPANFSTQLNSSNVNFQWLKDGELLTDSVRNMLEFENVVEQDSGVYTCRITSQNPDLDLILYRHNVVLDVTPSPVVPADSLVLVALYDSTNGAGWTNTVNHQKEWLVGNPIDWYGVVVEGGRVTEINLSDNNLTGHLPTELDQLERLEKLDLSSNQIRYIFPQGIDSLEHLTDLYLDNNQLSGAFQPNMCTFPNLKSLRLNSNNFSGAIPAPIDSLKNLTELNLSNNDFSGKLPPMAHLLKLERLYLNNNNFTDSVPQGLALCSKLKQLHVNNNFFTYLPGLDTLAYFSRLYAQNNKFSFGDLEHNMGVYDFKYSPQDSIETETWKIINQGDALTQLATTTDGTANIYQWKKLTGAGTGEVGTNDSILSIAHAMADHAGDYICEVRSSIVPGLTLLRRLCHLTVTPDSLVLVALYNSTGGNSWTNRSNWLSGTLDTWFGVTLDPLTRRVTALDLSHNNLQGSIPAEIQELSELATLSLAGNQLDELPDLSAMPALASVDVSQNLLTFEDLEPNMSLGGLVYSPQSLYYINPQKTIVKNEGETVTMQTQIGGLANIYQWKKDGTTDVGFDSETFTISNLDPSHSGIYSCLVQNSNVPGLEFMRRDIQLVIGSDSLALLALYNHADGANWTNTWDLGASMSSWYGVTVENGRVTALNLSNNQLSGTVPAELTALDSLASLYLNQNDISELENLAAFGSTLDTFDISSNLLTFEDLEQNMPIAHFNYAPQKDQTLDLPQNLIVNQGENVQMSTTIGGTNNVYLWQKNSSPVGDNSPVLDILNATPTDNGEYTCIVSNSSVPGLSYERAPVNVTVSPDSLILLELYAATDGANWTTEWNLAQNMETWHGITVQNGHVTQINLSSNQLKGFIPATLCALDSLEKCLLNDNEIENLENLSAFGTRLSPLDVRNNLLTFEDLEPNVSISNFVYAPQKLHLINSAHKIVKNQGENVVFHTEIAGANNQYAWKKNITNEVGTNSPDLVLNALTPTDNGAYTCIVTNPSVPGISYERNPVQLLVSPDSLILLDLYSAANGALWTNQWNLSQPFSQWHGVSVEPESKRVVALDLAGNSLSGTIPAGLSGLDSLEFLSLSSNQLHDFLPEMSALPNLSVLDISNNLFTFEDIEPNVGVSGFVYAPQAEVNTQQAFVIYEGSDQLLSTEVGGTKNTYQWKQNAQNVGINSPTHLIQEAKSSDAGEYTCEISNELATDLTLYRRALDISVSPDSLALVALYDSTAGANWTTIWDIPGGQPIDQWHGVEIENKRVIKLRLSGNSLAGTIPPALGKLSAARHIDLSNNSLQGEMPPISAELTLLDYLNLSGNKLWHIARLQNAPTLDSLYVQNNRLQFGDLEDKTGHFAVFEYAPQDSVNQSENYTLEVGTSQNLSTRVSGTENTYRWLKNGTQEIQTGNDSTYTLDWLGYPDAGVYSCQVSNPLVPDLTLVRRDIKIGLSPISQADSMALVALYNQTSGENWTNSWGLDTTNQPLYRWYGISVESGRVSTIELNSNNLNGTLTDSIKHLQALKTLNLADNNISAEIPPEIGQLSALEKLFLYDNQFSGEIPAELENLSLNTLNLNRNLLSGEIPPGLNGKKLTVLNLSNNQLSGEVPENFGGFSQLLILDVSGNQLEHLPDFSESSLQSLQLLSVSNNRLTFEDLEPNVGLFSGFNYSPQANVGEAEIRVISFGENTELTTDVGGNFNRYEWFVEGGSEVLSTQSSYTIENAQVADNGSYFCLISNEVATDLQLTRQPIQLIVEKTPPDPIVQDPVPYCVGDDMITLNNTTGNENTLWYGSYHEGVLSDSIGAGQTLRLRISQDRDTIYVINVNGTLTSAVDSVFIIIRPTITLEETTLRATFEANASYQWFRNEQLVGTGQQFAVSENGIYKVTLLKNGCSATSLPVEYLDGEIQTVGIAENLAQATLELFPNPNQGAFRLKFESTYRGKMQIEIRDIAGKLLHTEQTHKQERCWQKDFDISGFLPGMYFLKIQTEKQIFTKKAVKK